MNTLFVDNSAIEDLLRQPEQVKQLKLCGINASIHIAIPHYDQQLKSYYGDKILPDFTAAIHRSGINFTSKHFGLIIRFAQRTIGHRNRFPHLKFPVIATHPNRPPTRCILATLTIKNNVIRAHPQRYSSPI